MKKNIYEFCRRGFTSLGFGPMVLACLYMILNKQGMVETLSVDEVCTGIFSLSALAFIAGGMNVVYQIERLTLPVAILIHGDVLYVSYLATYLINGWLEWGISPIIVFTVIFAIGYLIIWGVIYFVTKKNTRKVNEVLIRKQEITED